MKNPQEKINEIQSLYKELLNSQAQLDIALTELKKSNELIKKLENFYFDGDWQAIYEQIENGANFNLTTTGEYSVMGEDTLWNAFHEQQTLLWAFMRTAMQALDKEGD